MLDLREDEVNRGVVVSDRVCVEENAKILR